MESYLFTPNPLSSKEYLRERLPDFVIQSLHCLEMLATIYIYTQNYIHIQNYTCARNTIQKRELKHMCLLPTEKSHQSRCDQWLLRFLVRTGFSLVTGRHTASGAKRRGNIYGGWGQTLNTEHFLH